MSAPLNPQYPCVTEVAREDGTKLFRDEGIYTDGLGTVDSLNPREDAGKWETDDPVSYFVLRRWDAGFLEPVIVTFTAEGRGTWRERWSPMGVRPEGHEAEGQHCGIRCDHLDHTESEGV